MLRGARVLVDIDSQTRVAEGQRYQADRSIVQQAMDQPPGGSMRRTRGAAFPIAIRPTSVSPRGLALRQSRSPTARQPGLAASVEVATLGFAALTAKL